MTSLFVLSRISNVSHTYTFTVFVLWSSGQSSRFCCPRALAVEVEELEIRRNGNVFFSSIKFKEYMMNPNRGRDIMIMFLAFDVVRKNEVEVVG